MATTIITLERLFSIASSTATMGWLSLAAGVLFRRRALSTWVPGIVVATTLALIYAALLAAYWHDARGNFSSLNGIGTLFQSPGLLLAGWIHYLAFDLVVGVMIVRQASDERLPRLLIIALLPVTFLFGPVGFALFQGLRPLARIMDRGANRIDAAVGS